MVHDNNTHSSTNKEILQETPSTPPPHLLLPETTPDHHFNQAPFYYDPTQQSPFVSVTGYQNSPQTPPAFFYDLPTTGSSPVAYGANYYYPPQFVYPPSPYMELSTPPMSPDVSYESVKGARQESSKSHNFPAYPSPYYPINQKYTHSPNTKTMQTIDGSCTPCNKNIYVRGIASTETDESFLAICQQFGNVQSSKAILDLRTNECKGFGFAMYSTEEEAQIALEGLNELGYDVSFARMSATPISGQESFNTKLKNLQDQESTNIYLSNLPLSMTEEGLVELLTPHRVTSHKILTDEFDSSRGVGFARLESREIAQKVISQLAGRKLAGSQYPLQVRFADSFAQKKLKNQVAKKKRNYAHPILGPTSPIFFAEMPQQYATSPIFYPHIQFLQHDGTDGSDGGHFGGLEKGVASLRL